MSFNCSNRKCQAKTDVRKTFEKLLILVVLLCSCSPVQKYEASAQKWERDIRKFDKLNSQNTYPENSILFVGSSSIRLWDTIEEDMAPYPVIQRGYGGASYADLACYIERIVYPHKFDALVLFAANDVWGKEDDRSPEEIARLLKYIIKKVNKKFDKVPIFVIEVTHTPIREHLMTKIDAENKALKSVCDQFENVYWIPTNHVYLTQEGKPDSSFFRKDKLHQNQEGYQQWARLIKEKLKSVLN